MLVLEGGAAEEQQVAEVLQSVTFQPWSKATSSDSIGKQLQRQNRPPKDPVPRKKVDRWVNPAVRKLDAAKEAEDDVAKPSGYAFERDGERAESSATQDRFSTTAVPLVSEAGARYQRLPINLDLQLYWARVLRQKGQQDLAVAILKQVLSSLPFPIIWHLIFFTHGVQNPRIRIMCRNLIV